MSTFCCCFKKQEIQQSTTTDFEKQKSIKAYFKTMETIHENEYLEDQKYYSIDSDSTEEKNV